MRSAWLNWDAWPSASKLNWQVSSSQASFHDARYLLPRFHHPSHISFSSSTSEAPWINLTTTTYYLINHRPLSPQMKPISRPQPPQPPQPPLDLLNLQDHSPLNKINLISTSPTPSSPIISHTNSPIHSIPPNTNIRLKKISPSQGRLRTHHEKKITRYQRILLSTFINITKIPLHHPPSLTQDAI